MSALQSIRLAHAPLRTSSVSLRRNGNTTTLPAVVTQLNYTVKLMSTGGYGDQAGDPISDNPQNQGPRPRIDTEHPGPEPVAEGRGKSGLKGHPVPEDTRGTAGDYGTTNKQANEMRSSGNQVESTEGKGAVQPKIHCEPQPSGKGKLEAEAHNENMKQKGHSEVAREDEVVGKGYWKGTGDKESI
ncbi:hypothetical protein EV426DRAFT_236080 [Tirmania nivea]|nr:hypothetical protein EV426DRAFT_236080 [Tirmania nivea]